MKIGELSSKTGVSRDTIRLYDKLGLLENVSRPFEYNNYKDYGEVNVVRIGLIKEMQRIGLKLKECKSVIDALVSDAMNEEQRQKFIKQKLLEVESKIQSLKQIESFLQQKLDENCAFQAEGFVKKLKG